MKCLICMSIHLWENVYNLTWMHWQVVAHVKMLVVQQSHSCINVLSSPTHCECVCQAREDRCSWKRLMVNTGCVWTDITWQLRVGYSFHIFVFVCFRMFRFITIILIVSSCVLQQNWQSAESVWVLQEEFETEPTSVEILWGVVSAW